MARTRASVRPVLEDEVRDLLRELLDTTGATKVAVVHPPGDEPGVPADEHQRVVPLGKGAFLCLDFRLRPPPLEAGASRERLLRMMRGQSTAAPDRGHGASRGNGLDPRKEAHIAEAVERSARALRACARRWGAERVPACALGSGASVPARERVKARILAYLQALTNTQSAINAVVTLRGRAVASSLPLTDTQRASIPFTIRRVDVEANRTKSSHGELVGDDFYAVSFWYHACLLIFFAGPYAVDFVRHRARLVTRELAPLLAWLDEPPPSSTNVAPIPE